jgi:hypothetical protein
MNFNRFLEKMGNVWIPSIFQGRAEVVFYIKMQFSN